MIGLAFGDEQRIAHRIEVDVVTMAIRAALNRANTIATFVAGSRS
jgi:hypothetical protein